jgi:predicted peptidase
MTNYQLGKIYKIICNTTGLTYYGSTCEPTLARRLVGHVHAHKCWKSGKKVTLIASLKVIEGGNYTIVLVELFPCDIKMELHKRERYHIETNECVNKNIPTRTTEEWYLENQSRLVGVRAEWYENNKESVSIQHAENHAKNREHISESYKKHSRNHRKVQCILSKKQRKSSRTTSRISYEK